MKQTLKKVIGKSVNILNSLKITRQSKNLKSQPYYPQQSKIHMTNICIKNCRNSEIFSSMCQKSTKCLFIQNSYTDHIIVFERA